MSISTGNSIEQFKEAQNNIDDCKNIYNEMTGGCKGGLRLLYLHLNCKTTSNK